MSNRVRQDIFQRSDDKSMAIINNNPRKKKKKLSLTNELKEHYAQFKRTGISQKEDHKISFLDPFKCENLELDRDDADGTKRLLRNNINALRDRIDRERWHGRAHVASLIARLNELRRIDRHKEDHVECLERMLADEDRVIDALRADIASVHDAYATRKRTCFRWSSAANVAPSVAVSEAVGRFASLCDDVLSRHADHGTFAAAVRSLGADSRGLDAEIRRVESFDRKRSRAETIGIVARKLCDAGVAADADAMAAAADRSDGPCPRTDRFLALWCATMVTACANHRTLEDAAARLDARIETLRTGLCRATAEHAVLCETKTRKKCEADVLDGFCSVTGDMTTRLMRRSLEYDRSRVLADRQRIGEKTDEIERLKAKLSSKKNKKQKLLIETDIVKSQLRIRKNQYDELKRRNSFLADDLNSMKRSPIILADQCELITEQRKKNLKQLRIQYSKLINKRDELKHRLQKYQHLARTPVE